MEDGDTPAAERDAERALRESEQKFRTLAETSSAAAFIHDGGNFLFFNRATEAISGYSREELRRMNFLEVVHEEDRPLVRERAMARLRGEEVTPRYEIRVVRKDGTLRWVEITGEQLTMGGQSAIIGTGYDITEQKRTVARLHEINEELVRANAELKSLDEMKANFISNISHELRTPLVTVQGYIEMLVSGRSGPLNDTQRQQLKIALRSTGRLSRLIDQLLEHSHLERGPGPLETEVVDLEDLCRELLESVAPRAESAGVALELTAASSSSLVRGDRGKLGQVLLNLLDNALKFSPDGGRVEVRVEQGEPGKTWVSVSDTGIGIPAELHRRIFERFYQADLSVTRRYSGLGMGLAISRELVELHGGPLEVTSAPGEGSTFRFSVPSARAGERPRRRKSPSVPVSPEVEPGHRRRVLLVDDDAEVLEFLRLLASGAGYETSTARDGDAARRILAGQQGVDLIVLDIAMPGCDGLELLESLKADERTANVPVLILSARAEESVKRRALAAGAAHFAVKPVSTAELLKRLNELTTTSPE